MIKAFNWISAANDQAFAREGCERGVMNGKPLPANVVMREGVPMATWWTEADEIVRAVAPSGNPTIPIT